MCGCKTHHCVSSVCAGRLEERSGGACCHVSHAEALRLALSAPVYAPGDTTGQDSWFVLEECRVRWGGYGGAGWGMGLQMGHSRQEVGQGGQRGGRPRRRRRKGGVCEELLSTKALQPV